MKITLTELRQIVKSIVKEQLTQNKTLSWNHSKDGLPESPEGKAFKGRTVQFYSDKANTIRLFAVQLYEVYAAHQGNNWSVVEIQTNKGMDYPIMFRCDQNAFTYRGPETQNKVTYIYNNKLMSELKPLCVKK